MSPPVVTASIISGKYMFFNSLHSGRFVTIYSACIIKTNFQIFLHLPISLDREFFFSNLHILIFPAIFLWVLCRKVPKKNVQNLEKFFFSFSLPSKPHCHTVSENFLSFGKFFNLCTYLLLTFKKYLILWSLMHIRNKNWQMWSP